MKDARAINAQLVDLRNVGTHKVVKLTLHVPEEYALRLTELFGWPTMVNPVPVALARMEVVQDELRKPPVDTSPDPVAVPGRAPYEWVKEPHKPARKWDEMLPAQQAGILCNEKSFQKFLHDQGIGPAYNENSAASIVREWCRVKSRTDLNYMDKRVPWLNLVSMYRAWQREPEVVG